MKNLITNNLSIGYSSKIIAKNLNLCLKSESLTCLLGQNGVGKSTLLRTLSNLQLPLSGEVLIDDIQIDKINRYELATQLGIITTGKIGTSNMTVRELVALGRYPYTNWMGRESTNDKLKIDEAVSLCKINYLLDAKLSAISDGQFQKVMIARVLAQDTEIIIMDEPTAHLDIVNKVEMFQLLNRIKRTTGKSILISTHELDHSMQFADELWLMNYNSELVIGLPEELGFRGELEKIFYHEGFSLNAETGQFLIDKELELFFNLHGDKEACIWLEKALLRNGYGLSHEGEDIVIHVRENNIMWKLKDRIGEGFSSLLAYCKEF